MHSGDMHRLMIFIPSWWADRFVIIYWILSHCTFWLKACFVSLASVCMAYLFPSLYSEPVCALKVEVSLFYTAESWVFLFLLRFCGSVVTEDRNWRARASLVPGTGTIKHHGELRGAEAGNASPTLSLRNQFVWDHMWVRGRAGILSSDPGTVSFLNTMVLILALSAIFKKKFIWNWKFCSNAKSPNQGKPSIQNYNTKRVTSAQQLHTELPPFIQFSVI